MENYVVNLRRELHQHAEIGFDLPQTLAILRRELDDIGVEYTEKYGKSSIVATVNPEKTGFTIGVRADIDALPIKEMNDVPYKSQNEGIMHACGHDSHAAVAMATLRRVWEVRDQLNCRVKFLFQAAEEYAPSGAMLMAKDGVMDDIDCIVCMHVDTNFPAKHFAITTGPQNATSDGFMLDFYGTSAHAARQHLGVDAIVMAMRALMDIELVVAKEINPKKPVIFNVGAIHGGNANNIIPETVEMQGTIRSNDKTSRELLVRRMKEIAERTAAVYGGTVSIEMLSEVPPLICDSKLTNEFVGYMGALEIPGTMPYPGVSSSASEDFASIADKVPGVFMYLSAGYMDDRGLPPAHNSKVQFNEDVCPIGAACYAHCATEWLKNNK